MFLLEILAESLLGFWLGNCKPCFFELLWGSGSNFWTLEPFGSLVAWFILPVWNSMRRFAWDDCRENVVGVPIGKITGGFRSCHLRLLWVSVSVSKEGLPICVSRRLRLISGRILGLISNCFECFRCFALLGRQRDKLHL